MTYEALDVVITDGRVLAGVENKIFNAQEQERQAAHYLDALKERAGDQLYRLVYLSPKGKYSGTYSLPICAGKRHEGKLVVGAWVNSASFDDKTLSREVENVARECMLDWLVDCQKLSRAENVAWLLKQFYTFLRPTLEAIF